MFQVFVFLVYQYKSIVIESTLQLVHLIFHVWPLKTYEILSNHQFLTIMFTTRRELICKNMIAEAAPEVFF